MATTLVWAVLAGLLTTLSPCVLPLLPFVVGSSSGQRRLAPLWMSVGLVLSFTGIGWGLAAFGSIAGLGSEQIRWVSAIGLILLGLTLSSTYFGDVLSRGLSRFTHRAQMGLAAQGGQTVLSQFLMGALLGAVWSPCSGPTLGAAVLLASRAGGQMESLLVLTVFAGSAVLPLLAVGFGFGQLLRRHQKRILETSSVLKKVMGVFMVCLGVLVLFGFDKQIEAQLTGLLPDFWLDLITRF